MYSDFIIYVVLTILFWVVPIWYVMDHPANQEGSLVIGRFTVGNLGFLNKKINKMKKKNQQVFNSESPVTSPRPQSLS